MWMMNLSASAFASRDAAGSRTTPMKRVERGDGIAFGGCPAFGIGLARRHGDVVERPRLLLPEGVGVRAFEVGPRRRLGDALGAEDAAYRVARVARHQSRGDRADDAVAGLAPRAGGGRGDREQQGNDETHAPRCGIRMAV